MNTQDIFSLIGCIIAGMLLEVYRERKSRQIRHRRYKKRRKSF